MKNRLPERDEVLTSVVSRLAGQDKPVILLTKLCVGNLKDAKCILCFYVGRWKREEAIHFLESRVQLEKMRTLRWVTVCRLVLLAVLLMIYPGWLFSGTLPLQ